MRMWCMFPTAGVMACPLGYTKHGFEMQIGEGMWCRLSHRHIRIKSRGLSCADSALLLHMQAQTTLGTLP